MNREIKFKALFQDMFEDNPPEWVYIGVNEKFDSTGYVQKSPWLEYTGFQVKNVDAYEGDIIQYKHYYATKRWWRKGSDMPIIEAEVQKQREEFWTEKAAIAFENGVFRAGILSGRDISYGERLTTGTSHSSDYEEKYWDFEIIGNKYTHPNLLEQ